MDTIIGCFGLVGISLGSIYTLQAFFVNAKGGFQPSSENASLLRAVGYQLYTQGKKEEVTAAIRASLKIESNPEASSFLKYLQEGSDSPKQKHFSRWSAAPACISAFAVVAIAAIIFILSNQQSGYLANYTPPITNEDSHPSQTSAAEIETNTLLDHLADLVATHAPVVGKHFEGTMEVSEHVLDRSKLDPVELTGIADQIEKVLTSFPTDPRGFVASAYFNACLLALSIYVVDGVNSGQSIVKYADQVKQLDSEPLVSGWLEASAFWTPYSELRAELDDVVLTYRPGKSLASLERELQTSAEKQKLLDSKAATLKTLDPYAFNRLVPVYNANLRKTRELFRRLKAQSKIADGLDLAFNRCIDPAILKSKFNSVDLTHSSESSS